MQSALSFYRDVEMSESTKEAFALLESGVRPMTEKMRALAAAAPPEDKVYFGMLVEGAIVRDSSDGVG